MRIQISAKPPFSLQSVINSHGWVRLAPFSSISNDNGLGYILQLQSGSVLQLEINSKDDGVAVDLEFPVSDSETDEIKQAVTWMLGLDQDFSDFYILAVQEPKLAHVVENAQGRVLRSPTLFEDTIKTILTTNTAWSGTIRMAQSLVDQFGSRLNTDSDLRAFPNPAQIASSNERTLRDETRLGYRSPYVLNLAREIASGDLDLEGLKSTDLPTQELRRNLLAIKGVGNYAAANLLMLLGHYSYLAIDSWALKVVSHEWYQDEAIGPEEVEGKFERWGKWKGLAYWLWDWSYEF